MTVQDDEDARSLSVAPSSGVNASLYRFELIRGALVRERPGDSQPRADRARFLIDVLLNEDEVGRYIAGVRGCVVPRRVEGVHDPIDSIKRGSTFEVGTDLMLAIGEALSVAPRLQ